MLGLPFFACVILSLWLGRTGPALLTTFLSATALVWLLSPRLDFLSVRGWSPLLQVAVFLSARRSSPQTAKARSCS